MTKLAAALAVVFAAAFLGVPPARAKTNTACAHALPRGPRHHTTCTHGGDSPPPGVNPFGRDPLDPRKTAAADVATGVMTTTGAGAVPCYGDGTSGDRVEAVYAVPAGTTDRYASVAPLIRTWAAATDAVFNASAAETGGTRHVRWVTDSSCNLVVDHVQLSATGASSFDNTINELLGKGFTRNDRKYLVWTDANVLCGIGEVFEDDSPLPNNTNNGVDAMFARVDTGCWGIAGQSIEAHELMHTLGGVQFSAPHSTSLNHCWDASEVMCYDDGSGAALQQKCPAAHLNLFDCNHDDYFSTAPAAGSYLTTHWNAAASSFLATTSPPPTWHLASAGSPSVGLVDGLSAASWGPGRLDVFGRGRDNAIWHAAFTNGAWQPWESLGGAMSSAPTAASWGAGRLDVFARGSDNALWHRVYDGTWQAWERVGGVLTAAPAAASTGAGRLEVVVRGTDYGLWQLSWSAGAWRGARSLGGLVTADPAVDSPAPGMLDIWARGSDNGLWWRSPTVGWVSLAGTLTSAPAASSWGGAHRDVFATGSDGGWWRRTFDYGIGWSSWQSIGSTLTGTPASVSWSPNRIDVVAVGAGGVAYDRWWG